MENHKHTEKGGSLLRSEANRDIQQKDRLPTRNAIVIKSNYLVEASHDLSLRELRLVNWVTRVIQEDDEDYKYYEIDVPLFLEYLQIAGSGSARDEIRTVTSNLMQRTIHIQISDDEWEQFAWLRYARILKRGNRLVLRLSINPEMRPYIKNLKSAFTKTPFYQITAFRSRYAWRFYEWCKQYEDTGWLIITVDDLRTRLQIQEGEYTRFNNLRQRVINAALTEINRVSDLNVTLKTLEKRGRFVHQLRFKINKSKVQIIPAEEPEADEQHLIAARLMHHGMPEAEAKKNVALYYELEREHLLGCLADLEHKTSTGFAFRDDNPLIWLRYILKNDPREQPTLFTKVYHAAGAANPPKEEVEAAERRRAAQDRLEHLQSLLTAADRHFADYRRAHIEKSLADIPKETSERWREAYIKGETPAMQAMVRKNSFWTSRAFFRVIEEFLTAQGISCTSREDWFTSQGIDLVDVNAEIQKLEGGEA